MTSIKDIHQALLFKSEKYIKKIKQIKVFFFGGNYFIYICITMNLQKNGENDDSQKSRLFL